MLLWGTEARASNIEFETHHHISTEDKVFSSHRQDDFIGDASLGTWSDKGYGADEGHKFNDFEYKGRDRDGDDDDDEKPIPFRFRGLPPGYLGRSRDIRAELGMSLTTWNKWVVAGLAVSQPGTSAELALTDDVIEFARTHRNLTDPKKRE